MRIFHVVLILSGVLMMGRSLVQAQEVIKEAKLAGSWYPGGKAELSSMLDGFLAAVQLAEGMPLPDDIGVIIAPHAGYPFSGGVAAYGFKSVASRKIATVIILAPTHHFSFKGAAVWAEGAFATPLGNVLVDKELASRVLAADKSFIFRKDVFEGAAGRPENSVETQIPFIQKVFPQAKIVPIIMGYPPQPEALKLMASVLEDAIDGRSDVLVVVSVDQSHFHPLAKANAIDREGLEAISRFDIDGLWQGHAQGRMEVDGFHVVTTAMLYAKAAGFDHARVLKYATSADVTKDTSSVVGYASIVLYKKAAPVPSSAHLLTEVQQRRLVDIARMTLDAFVRTGKVMEPDEKDPRLFEEEGAFVTLKMHGQLRGCIGNIIGEGPLYRTVRDMAVAAASDDPRFNPVTPEELKDIIVEVSVLSKPVLAKSADEIIMGKHGVIIRRGMRGGVFLPQVAAETGWDRDRFLSELCSQKAGLPSHCWKDPATRLEIFTADVFGEREK